jgi:hypothetical protein
MKSIAARSFDDSPVHADAVAAAAREASAAGNREKAVVLFRAILTNHPASAAANEALNFLVSGRVAAPPPSFEIEEPQPTLWPARSKPPREDNPHFIR